MRATSMKAQSTNQELPSSQESSMTLCEVTVDGADQAGLLSTMRRLPLPPYYFSAFTAAAAEDGDPVMYCCPFLCVVNGFFKGRKRKNR